MVINQQSSEIIKTHTRSEIPHTKCHKLPLSPRQKLMDWMKKIVNLQRAENWQKLWITPLSVAEKIVQKFCNSPFVVAIDFFLFDIKREVSWHSCCSRLTYWLIQIYDPSGKLNAASFTSSQYVSKALVGYKIMETQGVSHLWYSTTWFAFSSPHS